MGGYIKVVGVEIASFIMASNRSKVFLTISIRPDLNLYSRKMSFSSLWYCKGRRFKDISLSR